MLKFVLSLGLVVCLFIGALYLIGYTLAFIFICLAKLFDWLNQAYSWAKARWNERSAKPVTPEDFPQVASSPQQAPSPVVTPEPDAERSPEVTADEVIVVAVEAEPVPPLVTPAQETLQPAKDEPEAKVPSVEAVADVPSPATRAKVQAIIDSPMRVSKITIKL
jgi:hypothetical protein